MHTELHLVDAFTGTHMLDLVQAANDWGVTLSADTLIRFQFYDDPYAGYEGASNGWRRFDNLMMLVVTDGLTRLFSNDLPPLRLMRDLGLLLLQQGQTPEALRHAPCHGHRRRSASPGARREALIARHGLPGLGERLKATGADAVAGDMQEVARFIGA